MHSIYFLYPLRWIIVLTITVVIFVLINEWISLQRVLKDEKVGPISKQLWHGNIYTKRRFTAAHQLKDWHDFEAIARDAMREGLGEQGKPARIEDPSMKESERIKFKENGFNALISDKISVRRSVADIRLERCKTKQYSADLPSVSIVMPFYNEHFSALVRSIHSLLNRAPTELIKEIILIDDYSDRIELKDNLDKYIRIHFPKVKVLRLGKRKGLIAARLAGATIAVADVLVFMDSHIEANYNWLPPLLHPIALDERTVVCPMIDVIDENTFEYSAQDEGARGAFDWNFDYKRLPLLKNDTKSPTEPYASPIMAGGLFAISREWFWELGGYDDGLQIWGGEQYELSFKIWMCGGRLLDAPCSRVGHIFRSDKWSGDGFTTDTNADYVHRNFKRVAEVWMDDYKQYIYQRGPGVYDKIDAGDLTKQKELRNKLHCKSFKWFMDKVAFDLVKKYPPRGRNDYAYGQVRNLGASNLCLDTLGPPDYSVVGLAECEQGDGSPSRYQDWSLSEYHDMRMRGEEYCLRATGGDTLVLYDCHIDDPHQFWYYDHINQWLIYSKGRQLCLVAVPEIKELKIDECHIKNELMKWSFSHVNLTLLNNYFTKSIK